MVFMIASTNLVVELGIVLWLLIGWQFALAEFVGGAIMIVLLGLVLPRVMPERWIAEARQRLESQEASTTDGPHAHHAHEAVESDEASRAAPSRSAADPQPRGWGDASGYTISDLTMVRKELVIGFIVAGFLAALVPQAFWQLALPDRSRILVEPAERRSSARSWRSSASSARSATFRSRQRSGRAASPSAASSPSSSPT